MYLLFETILKVKSYIAQEKMMVKRDIERYNSFSLCDIYSVILYFSQIDAFFSYLKSQGSSKGGSAARLKRTPSILVRFLSAERVLYGSVLNSHFTRKTPFKNKHSHL